MPTAIGATKYLSLSDVKMLDEEGHFEARFAQLDTPDKDGEIIPAGTIGTKEVAISAWQHDHRQPPVGAGVTEERDGWAYVKGWFFLTTTAGRDAYETVKGMGSRQQWSFGFRNRKVEWRNWQGKCMPHLVEMDVFEVSPVYRGAAYDTATTSIKEETPESGAEDNAMADNELRPILEQLAASMTAMQEGQKTTNDLLAGLQQPANPAPAPTPADTPDPDPAPAPESTPVTNDAPALTPETPGTGAAPAETPAPEPALALAGLTLDRIYEQAAKAENVYRPGELHNLYIDAIATKMGLDDFAAKIKSIRIAPAPTPAPAGEPQDFDIAALIHYQITGDRGAAEKELRICEALTKEWGRPALGAGHPIPSYALPKPTWTKDELTEVWTKAVRTSEGAEAGSVLNPGIAEITERTPFDGLDLTGIVPALTTGPRQRQFTRVSVPDPAASPEPNTGYGAAQADPQGERSEVTPHTAIQNVWWSDQTITMAGEFVAQAVRIMQENLDEYVWGRFLVGTNANNQPLGVYNYTGGAADGNHRNIARSANVTALADVTTQNLMAAINRTLGREARYGMPSIICSREMEEHLHTLVDVTGISALYPRLLSRVARIVPTEGLGLADGTAKPYRMIVGPFGSSRISTWGGMTYMRTYELTGENAGVFQTILRRWFDAYVVHPSLFYVYRQD